MRAMLHRTLIVAAALAAALAAVRARLGEDRRGRAHGRRAGVPGDALPRGLAHDRLPDQGRRRARLVRRARGRQDRRLVDRARASRRPSRSSFFDKNLGGPASARLTVLRPGKTLYSRTVTQSPVQQLAPYFGQTVQFPLGRALNVKKGYVIALTVPTWAPALTPLLTDHSSWRASRAKGKCNDTGTQTAQMALEARRAVPLPLQGAADLLGDAGHAPGTQPGRATAGDVGSRGGVAASLTPAARSGTCGRVVAEQVQQRVDDVGVELASRRRRAARRRACVGGERRRGRAARSSSRRRRGRRGSRASRPGCARARARPGSRCRPSARARGGRSGRAPASSLVRARMRSPTIGCSDMTSHSSRVSGPFLSSSSSGMASLPTSCSSAAWAIRSTCSCGEAEHHRRRRGRAGRAAAECSWV